MGWELIAITKKTSENSQIGPRLHRVADPRQKRDVASRTRGN